MKKKEQEINKHTLQLRFANGDKELIVVVDTNISAYEYVNDVLTEHVTVIRSGKWDKIKRPKFIPCCIDMPRRSPQETLLLKKCKSEWKREHVNYKPTGVKVS